MIRTRKRRTPLTIRPRYDGLMSLWGKAVRLMYGTTCLRCGRQAPQWKIDAAHVLSRGAHPKLKYVVENGIPLCFLCHIWYDQHKGSKHDGEADLWVRGKAGEERYQRLFIREKTMGKTDKIMVRLALQQELKALREATRETP